MESRQSVATTGSLGVPRPSWADTASDTCTPGSLRDPATCSQWLLMFKLLPGWPKHLPGACTFRSLVLSKWSSTAATPAPPKEHIKTAERRQHYTQADDELISRRRKQGKSMKDIAEEVKRTLFSVTSRIGILMALDPSLRVYKPHRSTSSMARRIQEGLEAGHWRKEVAKDLGLSESTVSRHWLRHRASKARTLASRPRHWTVEERDRVLALQSSGKSSREIAMDLGRTMEAVSSQLARLRAGSSVRRARKPWTPEEDERMLSLLRAGRSVQEIGVSLDRHRTSVHARRRALQQGPAKPRRRWTDSEKDEARRMYKAGIRIADIAERLHRSVAGITSRLSYLVGLSDKHRRKWTAEETQTLLRLRNQEGLSYGCIASLMPGRTPASLCIKLSVLNNSEKRWNMGNL